MMPLLIFVYVREPLVDDNAPKMNYLAIVVTLIVATTPAVLGWRLRRTREGAGKATETWATRVGAVLLVAACVLALLGVPSAITPSAFAVMALMCPVGFLLGYGFAKVVIGADAKTARTVSMETGIQQVGIAGAIAIQTFKGQALDKAIATICAETNPWSRQNHLQLRPYFRTGHDRGLRDFHGRVRPAVERYSAVPLYLARGGGAQGTG